MLKMKNKIFFLITVFYGNLLFAQNSVIPGPADTGRSTYKDSLPDSTKTDNREFSLPKIQASSEVPDIAKKTKFVLKEITLNNMHKFSKNDFLENHYKKYINKEVTLEILWNIAKDINKLYQEKGYFLSRAYIPEQKIANGKITINVIEGYVGKLELPDSLKDNKIIKKYSQAVLDEKPSKIETIETFLLLMNDLPGCDFRSAFTSLDEKHEDDPAIKLSLVSDTKNKDFLIGVDNFSSRYFGPEEAFISVGKSFIPLQKTNLYLLTTSENLSQKYIDLKHNIQLAPFITGGISTTFAKGNPQYNLSQYDFQNQLNTFGINMAYQKIRKRDENLSFVANFDIVNSSTKAFSSSIYDDKIRAIRGAINYNKSDKYNGQNTINIMASSGLEILGSNKSGETNISQFGAKPDFKRFNLIVSRLQKLISAFEAYGSVSTQIASGILYSSEKFSYGGQSFGRAYDSSEISGDEGVNFAAEIRYENLKEIKSFKARPYLFYDIGQVISQSNKNLNSSASSAGIGMRFNLSSKHSGNIGIAFPLTKNINTPIYGGSNKNPRIFIQYIYSF
jgi:hemolysin activation/secretion protein